MKARLPFILLLGLLTGVTAHAVAPMDLKVFKDTDAQITALFRLQDQPRPEIKGRDNPFRASGEFPAEEAATTQSGDPRPVEVLTDEALLAQAVATLKVTGVIQVGGRTRLTINRSNYAEGDIVQVRLDRGTVILRVGIITSQGVSFKLNDAELVLNY